MSQTTTRVDQIATVIVPSTDQDRSIAFFADNFGLEVRADVPFGDSYRWVEVAPPGAQTTIALAPPREGDAVGVETGISLRTDNIDALHGALRVAGVDVDAEVSRFGGPVPPMFWFRDPDGNRAMVVEAWLARAPPKLAQAYLDEHDLG